MTWCPLPMLLSEGHPDDAPVAFGPVGQMPFRHFRARCLAASARLAGCRSAALVCRDSYAFAVGLFGLLQAGSAVVLPPDDKPGTLAPLAGTFERLIDDAVLDDSPVMDETPSSAPATGSVTFFTSGSTGRPKAVTRDLDMLDREVAVYEALWGPAAGTGTVVATVTHQHLYGLTFKILWSLAAGRPFETRTHAVWETLLPTLPPGAVLVSSPAHLSRLGGLVPLASESRPSLIFSAGAPLDRLAATDSRTILGHLPTEIFGSTETGAVATRRRNTDCEDWTLLPGHSLRSSPGGRLALYSPYSRNDVETADRVEPCPGGFRFLGRADRIAKIDGKRIDLADVERALIELDAVEKAVAVVLPGRTPRLAAAVLLTATGRLRLAELGPFRLGRALRQEMSSVMASAGVPRSWRFVESLPSHPLGKRRDGDVLALFGQEPRP